METKEIIGLRGPKFTDRRRGHHNYEVVNGNEHPGGLIRTKEGAWFAIKSGGGLTSFKRREEALRFVLGGVVLTPIAQLGVRVRKVS